MIYLVTDRYEQVSKNGPFEPFTYLKTNILPRQAQDKHRESTQKRTVFPQAAQKENDLRAVRARMENTPFLARSRPSIWLQTAVSSCFLLGNMDDRTQTRS